MIADPVVRHRTTPGRPQFAYALTDKASQHFPKNYCDLAAKLLEEVKAYAPPQGVNVIFEGVANRLSASAPRLVPGEPMTERLDRAVAFLNSQGYVAELGAGRERLPAAHLQLPLRGPGRKEPGAVPDGPDVWPGTCWGHDVERVSRVMEGASSCAYLVRERADRRRLPMLIKQNDNLTN